MLAEQFLTHWKQHFAQLIPTHHYFFIAVSGGKDSMALCHLMLQQNIPFTILHCNFKLRGQESERDEAFVKDFANTHNIPCLIQQFDTDSYASKNKLSIQEAARKLRYDWFYQMMQQKQSETQKKTWLLTAHHLNDQIETVIFNLARGTGVNGMCGMQSIDEKRQLIRPLLPFYQQQIVQYIEVNQIAFVEDSSNSSDKYTRNAIRQQLWPLMQQIIPQAEKGLPLTIQIFNDLQQEFELFKQKKLKKLLLYNDQTKSYQIPVHALLQEKSKMLYLFEILQQFNFSKDQMADLLKLCTSETGKYLANHQFKIIRNRNWLLVEPIDNHNEHLELIVIDQPHTTHWTGGVLHFEEINQQNSTKQLVLKPNQIIVSEDELQFPLLIRKWKQGDYFYPFGMKKKKKLSKFFIDLKLTQSQKNQVWIMESQKKILWILGLRADERTRITNQTALYLITFEAKS